MIISGNAGTTNIQQTNLKTKRSTGGEENKTL